MANEFKVKNGIKFPDNTVQTTAASGSAAVTVSDTAPGSPTAGMQWWDSSVGTLKIYYDDGTSSQWVEASATTAGPMDTVLAADTTALATVYPVLVTAAGAASTAYTSTTKIYFDSTSGQLSATNFNSLSDQRYKKDITTFPDALQTLSRLRGVKFKWMDGDAPDVGVIAQELLEVVPELVRENKELNQLTVAYSGLVGLLIQSVNELQSKVQELEKKVDTWQH